MNCNYKLKTLTFSTQKFQQQALEEFLSKLAPFEAQITRDRVCFLYTVAQKLALQIMVKQRVNHLDLMLSICRCRRPPRFDKFWNAPPRRKDLATQYEQDDSASSIPFGPLETWPTLFKVLSFCNIFTASWRCRRHGWCAVSAPLVFWRTKQLWRVWCPWWSFNHHASSSIAGPLTCSFPLWALISWQGTCSDLVIWGLLWSEQVSREMAE